jgi:hypothetical protein
MILKKSKIEPTLLVILNTEDCPKLFRDDVVFFDEVTELHISCDNPTSKKDCKDLVKFRNLEYLSISDLTLKMDVWIDFAQNCTQLKELHLYSGSFPSVEEIYIGDNESIIVMQDALNTSTMK